MSKLGGDVRSTTLQAGLQYSEPLLQGTVKNPPGRLRRVKSLVFDTTLDFPVKVSEMTPSPAVKEELKTRRLMRILFKDPLKDYVFVREYLHQGTLVRCRGSCTHLTLIREFVSEMPLRTLELLSKIHHPNIAKTYDAYRYDNKSYMVLEYLDISLLELGFKTCPLEEWEIATIVLQVRTSHQTPGQILTI